MLAEVLRDIAPPDVRIVEDHQLNIEHVTDLSDDSLALFIDASVAIQEGCQLQRIWPIGDGNFSTHAISPQALLNVYEQTMKQQAPDAWLLHVAARKFELGASPGNVANAAIDAAAQFLKNLLARPAGDWRGYLREASCVLSPSSARNTVPRTTKADIKSIEGGVPVGK
jgi:hypothetical protein